MMIKAAPTGAKCLLVDDLNVEDEAAFQAIYARNAAGAEKILEEVYAVRRRRVYDMIKYSYEWDPTRTHDEQVDEIIAAAHDESSARAKRLLSNYFVGYSHKSIGDCGSTTLCAEGVSMLAAKAIQDWPLYSGQETSTRAINMSTQRIYDPYNTTRSSAILDRWMDFYSSSQGEAEKEVRRRYPRQADEDEKAYENAVRYRVFDITRAFLPAGATTNVSWHTNLRQAGDHLMWLLLHPLFEVRSIAQTWQAMLQERYPSSGTFGGGAAVSGVGMDGKEDERFVWNRAVVYEYTYPKPVTPGFRHTIGMLNEVSIPYLEATDTRPRGCVLPHFMSDLGQLQFGFDIDFGSFRDIQRHRNGVCRMPLLTLDCGFERWYLAQLDEATRGKSEILLSEQIEAIRDVCDQSRSDDSSTQYFIPMGAKVLCSLTMGLPSFLYVAELRSTKTVHPTLRARIHWMVRQFEKSFPHIKTHIDRDPDGWDVRRGTQTIERKP